MKINRYITAAALAAMFATGCYEGELYDEGPDWVADKIAEEAAKKAANSGESGESGNEIEGLMEDVYTVGATDYSTGWWAQFSKYYQIPEGQKWTTQFNLNINPDASNTYKNFALVLTNDVDRGGDGYKEYGAIRYDHQPSGNSEWGDYIDRSLATSNLTFETDTDEGVDQLGGKVTLTIDRSAGGLVVTMTNGTITKTYNQTAAPENLNADASNTTIRAFLVPEGSFINFYGTTIEPIGGCTSAEDKQPLSMTLNGVPRKVLQGTELEAAFANVTATVQFETGVSSTVNASDLTIQAIPDMNSLGTKSLVAVYAKSYKGESAKPVIASVEFEIVDKMYTLVGAADNSTAFWGAHSDNIKIASGETYMVQFTNYTSGASNWNNFVIVLNSEDLATEYAVVRADNYGWGNGYEACTPSGGQEDWAAWLAAMDGAKVTAYISNNGDGTADIRTVMLGTDGKTYTQDYIGINTVDPDNCYFRLTVDGCHLEFDSVVGEENNSTAFWGAHSQNVKIPSGKTYTTRFTNFTNGASNWNNFIVVLNSEDLATEYGVVRADNYGWGNGYEACTPSGGQADWAAWLAAMDGAKVTLSITNKGDGTADIRTVMIGNDGNTYTQDYIGINTVDPDNCWFRVTVDGSHVVFE